MGHSQPDCTAEYEPKINSGKLLAIPTIFAIKKKGRIDIQKTLAQLKELPEDCAGLVFFASDNDSISGEEKIRLITALGARKAAGTLHTLPLMIGLGQGEAEVCITACLDAKIDGIFVTLPAGSNQACDYVDDLRIICLGDTWEIDVFVHSTQSQPISKELLALLWGNILPYDCLVGAIIPGDHPLLASRIPAEMRVFTEGSWGESAHGCLVIPH